MARLRTEQRSKLSAAADSRHRKQAHVYGRGGEKRVLELAKRAVGLERVTERDKSAHLTVLADAVGSETEKQKASTVSGC